MLWKASAGCPVNIRVLLWSGHVRKLLLDFRAFQKVTHRMSNELAAIIQPPFSE